MKVLFLIADPDRPSTRHRVRHLVPALEGLGVRCRVEEVPHGFLAQTRVARLAADHDVTILQRRMLSCWPARALRRRARRLVFDFDDAILYTNSPRGPRKSFTRSFRFRRTIRMADEIWPGNRVLEAMARPYIRPEARLRVVPTVIDADRWAAGDRAPRTDDRLVIGWMGAPGNIVYLEPLREVFDRLAERFPQAVLRIVSQKFIECRRMPVDRRTWTLESEVGEVRQFDIALAPLQDDPWTRGKCALRILNYLAAGVATVCSPVGANAEVVTAGETGEHARTPEEWYESIARLASDPARRERLARAGQERVRREYSIAALAPRLKGYLDALARGGT